MKTILIPTDYSDVAENALQYAIELAKFSKAKIILLHTYQIPTPTQDVPVMMISPREFEKENSKQIKNLEKKIISQTSGKIKVESLVRTGFISDEILYVAKEKHIDLIVMGVTGGGKFSEALMGSSATTVIKKTQIPVLIVPVKAKFNKVKKIALAYDYKGEIKENVINKFKEFVQLFKANVLVLDVVKPVEVSTNKVAIAELTLENALSNIKHTFYFPEAENIESEINSFVDSYKADWLVMIPQKHNILDKLFHESNTKKMAFHTHVPLLALHE